MEELQGKSPIKHDAFIKNNTITTQTNETRMRTQLMTYSRITQAIKYIRKNMTTPMMTSHQTQSYNQIQTPTRHAHTLQTQITHSRIPQTINVKLIKGLYSFP